MTPDELHILSFYRASELAGALLFGRIALHTDVDELRAPLTEQASEEAKHAWMITELITQLGEVPIKTTETFQAEIAAEFGMPRNILEVLCLTQVFEIRVLDHYQKHLRMKQVHPKVKATLAAMVTDEEGHVDWIEKQLADYATTHGRDKIDQLLQRVETVDQRVYRKLSQRQPFKSYFQEIL